MTLIRALLVIAGGIALQSCATIKPELTLTRREWTVMATTLEVSVYRPNGQAAQAAADLTAAYDEIADIDRLMSLYRADSELNALNAHAGQGWFQLSAKMFDVLQASKHYAELSSGAFDPTAQPLVKLWGFYRVENAAIPTPLHIQTALQNVGISKLTLDTQSKAARLEAGAQIDLGAIAKGYAVDRALSVLRPRGVPAALVNLGGNIGVLGLPPGRKSWTVGIQHPREPRLIGEIKFRQGAVATSGDYDRYIEVDGKRYSHLIDPRTGWPTEGVYALSVVAPNATAADALSTAAFVLGAKDGLALLASCIGTAGIAITPAIDALLVTKTPQRQDALDIEIEQDSGVRTQPTQGAKMGPTRKGCIWPISSQP